MKGNMQLNKSYQNICNCSSLWQTFAVLTPESIWAHETNYSTIHMAVSYEHRHRSVNKEWYGSNNNQATTSGSVAQKEWRVKCCPREQRKSWHCISADFVKKLSSICLNKRRRKNATGMWILVTCLATNSKAVLSSKKPRLIGHQPSWYDTRITSWLSAGYKKGVGSRELARAPRDIIRPNN